MKMANHVTEERRQAHELLDRVPEEKIPAVRGLLAVLVEPASHSVESIPIEEEELTPDTIAAIQESREAIARGEVIPHEEILREFGLEE